MKMLRAVIALLCLSSAVLAHDIYSNLRDRDGHLCCNGQEAGTGDGAAKWQLLPTGYWRDYSRRHGNSIA
jgi:hypothetical protein